ncbi:adenosylcobinamide-GDP ribazoletransferase [Methanotorris formicicus]|uniref:Adenosylcobinamide-GDP ribazoletransferase n=1 Tax=Methanotorris formicicus Mc-S-70 TaxID=647171 RepID=H1KZ25_9EURY|nr:adenosylcobinamide-GDP ribazoletransferase [Methanotorris formicicus]EHP86450.1 cobalamin 5'-phosphate synthase [Methanotorris formicicus Mc-S-70]
MIENIRNLIAFMTRIPIGTENFNFEEIANYFFILPIIGLLIGGLGTLSAYILSYIFPSTIVGVVVVFFLLYIQGFHHVDGLADFGDAWMVMGSPKRKLDVMKDVYMGIGGLIFVFFVELISIFAIVYAIEFSVIYILIAEVCSRLGMLACACCGTPCSEGTGRYFVKKSDEKFVVVGLILTLLIVFPLTGKLGVLCVILAVLSGGYIARVANKHFRCVNGDVLGASNEITRMIVLLGIASYLYINQLSQPLYNLIQIL